MPPLDFETIIVGAGVSGINTAYRLQTQCADHSYAVFEARASIGGTWDLFRYPGVRSDSDLHTYGFQWQPWARPTTIADAGDIKEYLSDSARIAGIDAKIRLRHKLQRADWSSEAQAWTLVFDAGGEAKTYRARHVVFATGYYNYDEPLESSIPGLDSFAGQVVHPQFWPEDLDYAGKNVVIIGSGATAVTLLPSMARTAARVTMLQRSPSYILALPQVDQQALWLRKYLPASWVTALVRLKYLIGPVFIFAFCRRFPQIARNILQRRARPQLPAHLGIKPHFDPTYGPWEQRLCVAPDGDFYTALREGKADVVTDTIETVREKSILLKSGEVLTPDIIVTATGIKLLVGGGAQVTVDGQPARIADKHLWKGALIQDIPNAVAIIGYTNQAWTLGADATAHLFTRVLQHKEQTGKTTFVPRLPTYRGWKELPLLDLNAAYVKRAEKDLPKAANVGPWRPRGSYMGDFLAAKFGTLRDLHFV